MSKSKSGLSKSSTLLLEGGIKYKGEIKQSSGVPHTGTEIGIMEWPNGDRYEGQFRHGKRHGQGKRINADGSTYIGSYEDDQPSGQGVYTWTDGETYDGQWKNGLFHGHGIKKVPEDNGRWTILDGNWHKGVPKGLGVCKYSDGS